MPYGLGDASLGFQLFVSHVFCDTYTSVVVYYILIHLALCPRRPMLKNLIYEKAEKTYFQQTTITFLGNNVDSQRVNLDYHKLAEIIK